MDAYKSTEECPQICLERGASGKEDFLEEAASGLSLEGGEEGTTGWERQRQSHRGQKGTMHPGTCVWHASGEWV